MASNAIVSLAIMAGLLALAGVPLRCWQFYSGRLRAEIPSHALAQATFSLCGALIFVPNVLAWAYAIYVALHDDGGAPGLPGAATAFAVGMLGCAYLLLEGFLLTARRSRARVHQPGNALANSAAKRE